MISSLPLTYLPLYLSTSLPSSYWLWVLRESSQFWGGKPLSVLGKDGKPHLAPSFMVTGFSWGLGNSD